MSKLFKMTDLLQVAPQKELTDLTKTDKHRFMDSILSSSDSSVRGLEVTFNLSSSARRINNRIYTPKGQRDNIRSWTEPYAKPIIRNHDKNEDPIGRFKSVQWHSLEQDAIRHFRHISDYSKFMNDMDSDDPRRIYKALKRHSLLTDTRWRGTGELLATALIVDETAIEKFLDGRYLTFSAGSHTDRYVCGICGSDWAQGDVCEHRPGMITDSGDIGVFVTGAFYGDEASVLTMPANSYSSVRSMQMTDSMEVANVATEDLATDTTTIFISDGLVDLPEFTNGVSQEASQEDGQEEEVKEEEVLTQVDSDCGCGCEDCDYDFTDASDEDMLSVIEMEMADKAFDHMMFINAEQMAELHEKGSVDIEQSSGKEKMIIRIVFRKGGKGEKDSLEYTVLTDEKMFKVPAGARGNARKVLEWKKKHGSEVKGMTPVGWARARQLANQSEIPLSTVKRMAAFNRHRKNAAIDPKFKDTPWKDRGYVAWLGWGGTTGVDWAIKISAANDSEEAERLEDANRSSPKGKGAKTPAEPSERIKGSKKNKKGSASSASGSISLSKSAVAGLQEKMRKHNEKHGDKKGKKVTLGMLKAVWRRGAGAFSSTHRPSMSRAGWAMARVNAFLKLVRSGTPSNPKYVQDNDLLPAGHPRKSSKKSSDALEGEELLLEDKTLTAAERNRLKESTFCGPERSYPVPDRTHAIAALSRAKQYTSGAEYTKIKNCVCKKSKANGWDLPACGEDSSEEILNMDNDNVEQVVETAPEAVETTDAVETAEAVETETAEVVETTDAVEAPVADETAEVTTEDAAEEKATLTLSDEQVKALLESGKLELDGQVLVVSASDAAETTEAPEAEVEVATEDSASAEEVVATEDAVEASPEAETTTLTDFASDLAEALKAIDALKAEIAELKSPASLDNVETVDNNSEAVVETLDVDNSATVENPSVAATEVAVTNDSAKLDTFTSNVVNSYKHILDSQGEGAAAMFLHRQRNYLPRHFNILNYL